MPTISTVSDVRAEGVLTAASATGAIQDEQITGALNLAFQRMMILFTLDEYDTVRLYTGTDPALIEKKSRWLHAECSYAISELASVLNSKQFVENGFAKQKSVGQSKIDLATPQDIKDAQATWDQKAIVWLRPYLSATVTNAKGRKTAFRTKDRKLTIIAI